MKPRSATATGAHRAKNEVTHANLDEVLRCLEALGNNNAERASNSADYLASPAGHNQANLCDTHILAIAAAQCDHLTKVRAAGGNSPIPMPPAIDAEQLVAAYDTRDNYGQLITAAVNRQLRNNGEAEVPAQIQVVHVKWDRFGVSWPITSSDDIAGAWALHLVVSGHYAEADAVLREDDTWRSNLKQAARLALYLETQRWGDLIDAVRHTVGDQNLSDNTLYGVAQACLGKALASLNNADPAFEAFEAAERTGNPATAAWAMLQHGLYLRSRGDDTGAGKLIARSMATNYTPQAETAQSNSDTKLRITTRALVLTRTDPWDITTEDDPEVQREHERESRQSAWREEANALLDRQIGMDEVKEHLRSIGNLALMNKERERRGVSARPANYNQRFEGPPGTGKTTIVDAFALYLASAGVVKSPEVVKVSAEDLTDGTVGGTAPKTKEAVASAKDKVLFIDEVYALFPDDTDRTGANSAGQEAVNTLVNLMEDLIGTTVFVFAGYPDKLARVMRSNPGLERRLPNVVHFPSFTLKQLAKVTQKEAEKKGYVLADDVAEKIDDEHGPARILFELSASGDKTVMDDLGNGGFARNLIEAGTLRQANRSVGSGDITQLSQDEFDTLTMDDIWPAFDHLVRKSMHGASSAA